MTINDLDESKVVSTPKEVKTPEALSGPVSLELEIETIADSLGVESDNSNYVDELRWLMDYAKDQATDNSREGLRWAIRELELKLGTPPFLEDKVKYLARYAYLFMESKKTNKELQKMTRGVDVKV